MIKKEVLEKMYLGDHKTLDQIAEHFKISKQTVHYWKKKHRIRTLIPWEKSNIQGFNQIQKEYLYGSLLGDDCLLKRKTYPYLSVVHSKKQEEYVNWKYNLWKDLVYNGVKQIPIKVKNRVYHTSRFATMSHPAFIPFYNLLYQNQRKTMTLEFLSQLTPFSLAVWYMDDGSYDKKRHRARISTNCFSHEENKLIQFYFKERWGINSNIGRSDSGTYYIWFNTESTIRLFAFIGEYILPYFSYKINLNRKLLFRRLTKKELEYIQNNYNTESPQLIAYKLGRSVPSVFDAACKLGVTQRRGGRKYYEKNLTENKDSE